MSRSADPAATARAGKTMSGEIIPFPLWQAVGTVHLIDELLSCDDRERELAAILEAQDRVLKRIGVTPERIEQYLCALDGFVRRVLEHVDRTLRENSTAAAVLHDNGSAPESAMHAHRGN